MVALEAFGVVFGLLGVGVMLASCAWLAWWMLEPINRVAGELQGTTRFMLTDVLGLMVLLQIGLAITGRSLSGNDVRNETEAMYWLLMALMGVLVVVLWAASVSVVSRAGILRPARRIAVMVLCVPGTLLVMVALPVTIGAFVAGSFTTLIQQGDSPFTGLTLALLALGAVGLAVCAFVLRCISFWSLAGSPGGETLQKIMAQR